MVTETIAALFGHHVEQVDAGLTAGGDGTQGAHHLLDMARAGIGDQKVAEHGLIRRPGSAYGRFPAIPPSL
jgi:hypothetical protein